MSCNNSVCLPGYPLPRLWESLGTPEVFPSGASVAPWRPQGLLDGLLLLAASKGTALQRRTALQASTPFIFTLPRPVAAASPSIFILTLPRPESSSLAATRCPEDVPTPGSNKVLQDGTGRPPVLFGHAHHLPPCVLPGGGSTAP